MKNKVTQLLIFAACAVTASAQVVVPFNTAADITNNFRQTRSNANVLTINTTAGAGPGGSTNFANFGGAADNNAVRYAYDTDTGAGVTTFTTGFLATDINWTNENTNFGLWFGGSSSVSPTDVVEWTFRLNNAGTLENGKALYNMNVSNNFGPGTTLTTTSGTAITNRAGTPTLGVSTDTYANVGGVTAGNWYSLRLDFGLNGSGERTFQLRMWDAPLSGSTGLGSGTLKWDQSFDIVGTAYNGVGQVGFDTFTSGGIDNFTVVPEPSTVALLTLGFSSVLFLRRRRQVS